MIHSKVTTHSPEETIRLGERLGQRLRGGECIELISDLGGGKTTFVRGLAKGTGSKDHVSSPTFTISKVYRNPKFKIVHFDFYRLQEAGLIEHEIEEAIYDPASVIVVEWSEVVRHVLPEDRLVIHISPTSDSERTYELAAPHTLGYLIKDEV